MTADTFRRLALGIPGAIESSHMDHADFRVGGRIFASLGVPDDNWGMVKLTPEQQRAHLRDVPDAFKPCQGAWGRQGCTYVLLAAVTLGVVRGALLAAAKNISNPAKKKKRRPTRAS